MIKMELITFLSFFFIKDLVLQCIKIGILSKI